jgi:hypothetical protein
MHGQLETITPQRAKELRANKFKNRPLKATAIAQFAADMKAGRWGANGQPIIISTEGQLLDGQNRIEAIIESGCTVEMFVVYDVPEAEFATMDTGSKRTLGDVLGLRGIANAPQVASMARTAYAFLQGTNLYTPGSKPALLQFVINHPHIETVATYAKSARIASPTSAFGAVLFLATESRRLDGEAHDFAHAVSTGLHLKSSDPAYALRQWVEIRTRNRLHTVTAEAMFAATVRAWNAFALGEPLQRIANLAPVYRETYRIVGLDFDLFKDVPRIQRRRDVEKEAPPVRRGKVTDEVAERVFELSRQGLGQKDIAIDVQIGMTTVQRILSEKRKTKLDLPEPDSQVSPISPAE